MKITNNTSDDIVIHGYRVVPGSSCDIDVYIFDTINIYGEVGSVEIVCEYHDRHISCYGKVEVKEVGKDEFVISEKRWN